MFGILLVFDLNTSVKFPPAPSFVVPAQLARQPVSSGRPTIFSSNKPECVSRSEETRPQSFVNTLFQQWRKDSFLHTMVNESPNQPLLQSNLKCRNRVKVTTSWIRFLGIEFFWYKRLILSKVWKQGSPSKWQTCRAWRAHVHCQDLVQIGIVLSCLWSAKQQLLRCYREPRLISCGTVVVYALAVSIHSAFCSAGSQADVGSVKDNSSTGSFSDKPFPSFSRYDSVTFFSDRHPLYTFARLLFSKGYFYTGPPCVERKARRTIWPVSPRSPRYVVIWAMPAESNN